jgi:signal transduction histidine kinase
VLHDFLASHRTALIDRCRLMAANRPSPPATEHELVNGIPTFLDQLIETLRLEQTSERGRSPEISGVAGGGTRSQIGDIATLHGRELLQQGYSLEQVVRDYGDVCQAVTNLAYELTAPIEVDEFRTFNRCIDNAIASAVDAYALQQAATVERDHVFASNSRMGAFVHELRNYLHVVTYAVRAIKVGNVGVDGATGAVLDRSLLGMRALIDRSVAEVRLTAALPARVVPIPVARFIVESVAAASLDLQSHDCELTVAPVDPDLVVVADPEMLHAAVFNLLQNAFKFTQPRTAVVLRTEASGDRVLIEVADHCGGLKPGAAARLLQPFVQDGEDRSGLGLGLDICRRGVESSNGTLRVRDVPGSGCVFTIDLPRARVRATAASPP